MIRLTFIVGGGKLLRSKYNDRAGQAVTSTLKQLGFVEDRGASCIADCAGCFKLQHDTGKNTKTVVVFPRLANHTRGNNSHDESGEEEDTLIPSASPGYKMAVAPISTFK